MSKAISLENLKTFKEECDKAYAGKEEPLIAKVVCTHQYEITGQTNHEYNLAIPDESSVVITKIQGHSRRKSLNEWKLKPGTHQNLTVTYNEDGSYTFNGQGGVSVPLERQMIIGETYSFVLEKISGEITGTSINEFIQCGQQWFSENVSYRKYDGNGKTAWFNVHSVFNNLKVKLNVIKGTYNNETMPLFQPYDNTLVNSNNTLISTGRNLVDIKPFNAVNGWNNNLCDLTLIKGRYFVKVESDSNQGACIMNIGEFEVYPTGMNLNTAYWFDVTNPVSGKVDMYFNTANNNVKVQIRYVPTGNINFDFEPYKEDTITTIGSLGEFDYILPQSNQRVRQTSQVVTLNGSENWNINTGSPNKRFFYPLSVNAIDNPVTINVVSNNLKEASVNDTYSLSQEDNLISASLGQIQIVKRDFTTVDQLKQWLKQKPIQLVYKLATPTYETVSVPSGYKVSNGGMQLQVGDVPYTLYKEYAVSLRAQVENNAQINVQQQGQINELKFKVDGLGNNEIVQEAINKNTNNEITKNRNSITQLQEKKLDEYKVFKVSANVRQIVIDGPGTYLISGSYTNGLRDKQINVIMDITDKQYNVTTSDIKTYLQPDVDYTIGVTEVQGRVMIMKVNFMFESIDKTIKATPLFGSDVDYDFKLKWAKRIDEYVNNSQPQPQPQYNSITIHYEYVGSASNLQYAIMAVKDGQKGHEFRVQSETIRIGDYRTLSFVLAGPGSSQISIGTRRKDSDIMTKQYPNNAPDIDFHKYSEIYVTRYDSNQ